MSLVDLPRQTLPRPTRDLERAFEDLDRFGYAILEGALSRERVPVEVQSVAIEGMASATAKDPKGGPLPYNDPQNFNAEITVPARQPVSQPYWLREPRQVEQ